MCLKIIFRIKNQLLNIINSVYDTNTLLTKRMYVKVMYGDDNDYIYVLFLQMVGWSHLSLSCELLNEPNIINIISNQIVLPNVR